MKPTKNMQAFIDANKENKVIFGELQCNELLYKLDNLDIYWLTNEDIKSAPDFTPDWGFDK